MANQITRNKEEQEKWVKLQAAWKQRQETKKKGLLKRKRGADQSNAASEAAKRTTVAQKTLWEITIAALSGPGLHADVKDLLEQYATYRSAPHGPTMQENPAPDKVARRSDSKRTTLLIDEADVVDADKHDAAGSMQDLKDPLTMNAMLDSTDAGTRDTPGCIFASSTAAELSHDVLRQLFESGTKTLFETNVKMPMSLEERSIWETEFMRKLACLMPGLVEEVNFATFGYRDSTGGVSRAKCDTTLKKKLEDGQSEAEQPEENGQSEKNKQPEGKPEQERLRGFKG